MIRRPILHKLRSVRGASMVEFALVLPIFLLLLCGMIEFSILFYDKAVMTNASREGARFGSMYRDAGRAPAQEIRDQVKNYCQTYLINFQSGRKIEDSDIKVTVNGTLYDPATFDAGDVLSVELTYPYTFLVFPNVAGLVGASDWDSALTLIAKSQMRGE